MSHTCTDCKKFWNCEKNDEEWAKVSKLYPITEKEANINHLPRTLNEKRRLVYINMVAERCGERAVI